MSKEQRDIIGSGFMKVLLVEDLRFLCDSWYELTLSYIHSVRVYSIIRSRVILVLKRYIDGRDNTCLD